MYIEKFSLLIEWTSYDDENTKTPLAYKKEKEKKQQEMNLYPVSHDDSEIRQGFGAETSFPLTKCAPTIPRDITRFCGPTVLLSTIPW